MSLPNRYVPPRGDLDAPYVVVGEQPGWDEARAGRPFIGKAGREAQKNHKVANIGESEIYYTNVVKDLSDKLQSFVEKPMRKDPIWYPKGTAYRKFLLEEELPQLNPKVIIAYGNVALLALTGRWGILNWRGSVLKGPNDVPVLACVHPSFIIRGSEEYRFITQLDLLKAYQIKNDVYEHTNPKIWVKPSFEDVVTYLKMIKTLGESGEIIAYDLEVGGQDFDKQVTCISFGVDGEAMSIPFVKPSEHGLVDYFKLKEETHIWELITEILQSDIWIVGQNLGFDAQFNLRRYGIHPGLNMHDTMIAQHTVMPGLPKGLDFITSIWTNMPYYKADGKAFIGGKATGKYEKFWNYNGLDSVACTQALPKQLDLAKKSGNLTTYNRQRRLIHPLTFMMEHGIKVDVGKMAEAADEYDHKLGDLLTQIHNSAGMEINPNSPKQLYEFFYNQRKYRKMKNKKGKVSTDADCIKKLIAAGSKTAALISRYKLMAKRRSTYLNIKKVDPDGRIRCSYNPVGTQFSRLSSSASIFGTGMNLQNWPYDMRSFLVPDDDHIFISPDLSQAENRIVANVSGCNTMINAFETGDVHTLTAKFIMSIFYDKSMEDIEDDEVRLDRGGSHAPLGDSTHEWRFWGKKANHGLNYDLGPHSFAQYYELALSDAELIVNGYHNLYPEVRINYHTYVRRCLRESRTIENLMGRKTRFFGDLNDKTFKQAYSCIPQGTVGDLINEYGLENIYYNQDRFRDIILLTQTHDDIGFEMPLRVGFYRIAEQLMNLRSDLEVELTTHTGRKFTIPTDIVVGLNLNKEEGVELSGEILRGSVDALAIRLEEIVDDLKTKRSN